jgi:hypothetical protein
MDIISNTGTGGKASLRKIPFNQLKTVVWEHILKPGLIDANDDITDEEELKEFLEEERKYYQEEAVNLAELQSALYTLPQIATIRPDKLWSSIIPQIVE